MVMNTILFLIKNIMLRRKSFSRKHFFCHHIALFFYCVIRAHSVIDKISALIQFVLNNKLLYKIHVFLNLKVAESAIVPGRTAHWNKT